MFIILIVESIYIIYVLNYFKTRYSLAHPLTYFETKFIFHPIGKSDKAISNICPFGHMASWFLALFVLIRLLLLKCNIITLNFIIKSSKLVLFITILFSFMNFNAVVYLLPVFILEFYLIYNNFFKLLFSI